MKTILIPIYRPGILSSDLAFSVSCTAKLRLLYTFRELVTEKLFLYYFTIL